MKYLLDRDYLLTCFEQLVSTPSVTGDYSRMKPLMETLCAELGHTLSYDNKKTAYLTLEGEDPAKTVMVSAHLDTIGLMVRKIDGDGKLRVRAVGGVNYVAHEGENVTIHTRGGKDYTGILLCQSHSTHSFSDARSLERNENTMIVVLDENVSSKEEVEALGICNGDFVSIDPHCTVTPTGFVKSRFIDDKGAVAVILAVLKYMKEQGLQPKYRTILSFPYCEELGLGGCYLPEEVSEYVAMDIGLIAPDLEGNEQAVSICAKDASVIYDYDLTTRLIECAKNAQCDYAVDVFLRYGSDAGAALKAGNNVASALFGMAVYGSHGRERTHIRGLENTGNLLLAYLLD